MILVKLQGGLGNQMFQYAVARALIDQNSRVYFDHKFLEKNNLDTADFTARPYELQIFTRLRASRASSLQLNYLLSNSLPFKILRTVFVCRLRYICQLNNEFVGLSRADINNHTYLDGYFQSERYFQTIRTELLNEFHFAELDPDNENIKNYIIKSHNSVSIHFRRGDYLKTKEITEIHGVLPMTYYERALRELEGRHGHLTLFIFSDDIGWVRKNFNSRGKNVHFVEENQFSNGWKDMALMKECKHHIIANSSYSWWGAWLSQRKGQVFAPINWFNPEKVKFDINDFIPKNWTIIQ